MRQPPVVITAEIDIEHINSRPNERRHVIKRLLGRSFVFKFAQGFNRVHSCAVSLVKRQGKINTVHDGIRFADASAYFFDYLNSESLPVGKSAERSSVESCIGHLLQKISFMAVQVNAVNQSGFGV